MCRWMNDNFAISIGKQLNLYRKLVVLSARDQTTKISKTLSASINCNRWKENHLFIDPISLSPRAFFRVSLCMCACTNFDLMRFDTIVHWLTPLMLLFTFHSKKTLFIDICDIDLFESWLTDSDFVEQNICQKFVNNECKKRIIIKRRAHAKKLHHLNYHHYHNYYYYHYYRNSIKVKCTNFGHFKVQSGINTRKSVESHSVI